MRPVLGSSRPWCCELRSNCPACTIPAQHRTAASRPARLTAQSQQPIRLPSVDSCDGAGLRDNRLARSLRRT